MGEAVSLDDRMIEFLLAYDNESFYVRPSIPQKKLQSAVKSHGVDPRDTVWALLDSTVLGSAENGLSVTSTGIFWKNMWTVKTRRNHYTWSELSSIYMSMEAASGNVRFAPGVEFYAPANFKAAHVVNMLQALTKLYIEYVSLVGAGNYEGAEIRTTESSVAPTPILLEIDRGYAETLGRCMAVMACCGGFADEKCVELSITLLEDEERQHPGALSVFAETLAGLETESKRSPTFFKLRRAKILSEIKPASRETRERIIIMCDALSELIDGVAGQELLSKVTAALSC